MSGGKCASDEWGADSAGWWGGAISSEDTNLQGCLLLSGGCSLLGEGGSLLSEGALGAMEGGLLGGVRSLIGGCGG